MSNRNDTNKPAPKMLMRGGRGGGPGGMHGMGMPIEKPKDFKGTFKKLLNYLKPRKVRLIIVFFLAALSTVFTIFSPKVMGRAITKLFEGIMMKMQGVDEETAREAFRLAAHKLPMKTKIVLREEAGHES